MPTLYVTEGWMTRTTSPSAEPMATPTRAALGERSEASEQARRMDAHADAVLENTKPSTVAGPCPSMRANSSTSTAVMAHPSAMTVSRRRSSSEGLRVATKNKPRNRTLVVSVDNSRAMP